MSKWILGSLGAAVFAIVAGFALLAVFARVACRTIFTFTV